MDIINILCKYQINISKYKDNESLNNSEILMLLENYNSEINYHVNCIKYNNDTISIMKCENINIINQILYTIDKYKHIYDQNFKSIPYRENKNLDHGRKILEIKEKIEKINKSTKNNEPISYLEEYHLRRGSLVDE